MESVKIACKANGCAPLTALTASITGKSASRNAIPSFSTSVPSAWDDLALRIRLSGKISNVNDSKAGSNAVPLNTNDSVDGATRIEEAEYHQIVPATSNGAPLYNFVDKSICS